jgi:hypothetical protein
MNKSLTKRRRTNESETTENECDNDNGGDFSICRYFLGGWCKKPASKTDQE